MTHYPPAAWERAMKMQEVMLRAASGEITWIRAADILGISPRSLRRWKRRFDTHGYEGLLDHRTGRPSPRRAPFDEVQRILRLYRETYLGFNVRHFHQIAQQDHGVTLSYTFVKEALQGAGLVRKRKKRGCHRKYREPRACFGEMLLVDGSEHAWLAHATDDKQVLIAVVDDATKYLFYAQLWPAETTWAVMWALFEVVSTHGIPMALYTDRASWAWHTPKGSRKVDKDRLTQIGRVLARLGVEHIPSYSPQARGRSERLNRTLQDRLINELRLHQIKTADEANQYLRDVFIPDYNERFTRSARDPHNVFVKATGVNLDRIFCIENKRTVAKDNTVVLDGVQMQLKKQPGRTTCAGLRVKVLQHLNGFYTVWHGFQLMGCFDLVGKPVNKKVWRMAKTPRRAKPSAPFPPPPHALEVNQPCGHFTC
ncbi:ISNCY family transposase [Thermodesulfobacteriota bacterium]